MHPPWIVTTEHGKHEADTIPDIFEATENIDRYRNRVARREYDFASITVFAPEKSPRPGVNDEHFLAMVAVQGIGAARRLAGTTDIEAVRLAYVYMLRGILGYTWPDDGEVFFFIAARAARINECIGARPQFGISNQSRL